MLQVWYIFCSLVKDLDWLHLMCSILYSMDISATTWYLLYLLLAKTVGTNITAWDPAETYPGFGSTGEGEVQQKGFQKKRSFVVTHITRCFTKEKCRLLSTGTKCNSFKRSWQWEVTHVLMSGNIKNEPQTFLSFKTPAGGTLLHKLLVSELFFFPLHSFTLLLQDFSFEAPARLWGFITWELLSSLNMHTSLFPSSS